ncbi:MAG TPA: Ig-like domain-containing protein, partial [Longimicrobiaceae bacterium]|nr:Ig-like domain-containing protein [Longimicrobiaceae bacterium]
VPFHATGVAGPAAGVFAVSGDGQTGTVGGALPGQPAVRMADAHGNPIAGATVEWRVTVGGGTVSPASGRTDDSGLARTAWTLGTVPGSNTLQALSPEAPGSLAVFRATASPGAPAVVAKLAGEGQSGPAGSALPAALTVRVTDRYGNPLGGIAVGWSATAGGGTLDPPAASTGPDGTASARWTLGAATLRQTAHAAVGGVAPAQFGATASSGVELAELRISPAAPTMYVGSFQRFTVTHHDAAGAEIPQAWSIRWLTSNPGVARMDYTRPDGPNVLGVTAGTATITASSLSGKFATATVTVVDRAPLGGDDFDTNTLGSYTARGGPGGAWSISNGVLVGSGTSENALLIRNGVSLGDGWVETVTNHAEDAGLVLRYQADGRYYLLAIRDDASVFPRGERNLELYRMDGNSYTILRQIDVLWQRGGPPSVVRFQAVGSTLSVFFDGRLVHSQEDSWLASPGGLGVRHYGLGPASADRFLSLRWGAP